MDKKLQGIIPPLVTLFNKDFDFNWKANEKLINYVINGGVNAVFGLGSLGEFAHLTIEERKEYTDFLVKEVDNRVPVLVGTGHTSTKITIELSEYAQKAGADYVVVVNPYYWNCDREAIYYHYKSIAESVDIPIIIYNFPDLTGVNITANLIRKLAFEFDNIVGLKDTIDSMTHIKEVIQEAKSKKIDFSILAGLDHYLLTTLTFGGDGIIGGTANFYPQLGSKIFKAFNNKKYEKAFKLQKQMNNLSRMYSLDIPSISFISLIKEAINIFTPLDISTTVRKPALAIGRETKKELEKILNEF